MIASMLYEVEYTVNDTVQPFKDMVVARDAERAIAVIRFDNRAHSNFIVRSVVLKDRRVLVDEEPLQ